MVTASHPSHPLPFRSSHNASHPFRPAPSIKPPPAQPSSCRDPFYGHEQTSKLCARFITHLFVCPKYPPLSSNSTIKLPYFIAYALHTTKLHPSVTFGALVLLQRLKARFPTARGLSGYRLFISAFMLASKVICDSTYPNKSWSIVAQGMFQLWEINQLEREMCQYLEWELNVDPVTLREFEKMVRKDFVDSVPYPVYILPSTKMSMLPPTTDLFAASSTMTSPSPPYGQHYPPPKPVIPAPPNSLAAYMTLPTPPDTPSPSYFPSTSPASSASPPTPPSIEDYISNIVSASLPSGVSKAEAIPILHSKTTTFAFASPAVW